MSEDAAGQWERRAEVPLAVAAVLFLVAYAAPILKPGMSAGLVSLCSSVNLAVWGLFALDYLARIALARNRARYIARHIPDLLMIALPLLRPLRLLRLVQLLRVMNRKAETSLRGRIAIYVVGSVVLVVFCAALAVLDTERHSDHANITTFGDALWWAITTVTTVGYGDRYPTTAEGRMVAVGLMLAGIALLGVVTASIASWLIDRVREVETEGRASEAEDLAALRDQIHSLTREVAALRGGLERRELIPVVAVPADLGAEHEAREGV